MTLISTLGIPSLYGQEVINIANNDFSNANLLNPIFDKLYSLESTKNRQINIVHIGDSHVQADFFTNAIRQPIQARFGNAGYGFTFPYKLAKTNGTGYIQYTSDIEWNSRRNIYPVTDISIGLAGIALYTNQQDFDIDVEVNPLYTFDKIKILYPGQDLPFDLTVPNNKIPEITHAEKEKLIEESVINEQRKYITHRVQPNETLYRLSVNYKVSVDDIKKANRLESNTIRAGMGILIPNLNYKSPSKTTQPTERKDSTNTSSSIILASRPNISSQPFCTTYSLVETANRFKIESNNTQKEYNLSGVVLEKNRHGIIYHSIGVNGAKVSDYNKYPLFFEQLPILNPDLLIISLGTNEAFGKWTATYYVNQIKTFINNVRRKNPNTVILVMTPPPSLFNRKLPNTFITDYKQILIDQIKDCVIWDLLGKLGGASAPSQQELGSLMAKDKVHFTKAGYEMQGDLFLKDFLSAYDNYAKIRNHWKQ